MSLDKIKSVIEIEQFLNDFNDDYDVEVTIVRRNDNHGTKLSIGGLQDVFQMDFLTQFITSIRSHEQIEKQEELTEYMKKLNEEKEKNAKKTK